MNIRKLYKYICLLVCFLILIACSSVPQIGVLPKSSEDVDQYLQEAEAHMLKVIQQLISVPDSERTTEKMMRPWNRLAGEVLSYCRVLNYLAESESSCREEASQGLENFKLFIYGALMQNKDLYQALMAYIEKSAEEDKTLTPYDRQEICSLLESFGTIGDLSKIEYLKGKFSEGEKTSFIYLESPKTSFRESVEKEITVFSLNTCFIPDNFPYLYGGATLPWQKRIKALSEEVIKVKADVVCLQEVFSEDSFYALYEELKEEYKYFYGSIGPRFLGMSFNTIGLSSGLFVASKILLESPQFTLFPVGGFPMNYGFFDFVLRKENASSAHIYTTHLHPLDSELFIQIRASQLRQIVEKMEFDRKNQLEKTPLFLCGDLNIPWGSLEPAEQLIRSYFHDNYNQNRESVSCENSTCTYYFTNYLFSDKKNPLEIDPNFQILDYALLPKLQESECSIHSTRVSMNDLSLPESAVSDHHGLFTIIQKK